MAFRVVDAFAASAFEGVPTGIVTQTDGLAEDHLASIAREIGAGSTTFLFPGSGRDSWFRLRSFSRDGAEISFSPEGTVAAYHALHETGLLGRGRDVRIAQEDGAGRRMPVELRGGIEGALRVHFPCASFARSPSSVAEASAAEAFHVPTRAVADAGAAVVAGRLLLGVRAQAFETATPDPERCAAVVREATGEDDGFRGATAFVLAVRKSGVRVTIRDSPATPSRGGVSLDAIAAVAFHLGRLGMLPPEESAFEEILPGPRVARILVETSDNGNRIMTGGSAVTVASGRVTASLAPAESIRLRVA